jgi:adenosylcobinamide-GDP ribazoletransferase
VTVIDDAQGVTLERPDSGIRAEVSAAVGILTRLPVASRSQIAGGAAFGLVGALVGAVGGVVVLALGSIEPSVAAVLALGLMAVVSGGLHLDGLADTADALVAPNPDAAERARSDPRAGPAAVATLVLVLAADWSLIVALVTRLDVATAAATVTIAAAAARASVVLAPVTERGAFRRGFGSWFAERVRPRDGLIAAASVVVLSGILAVAIARPTPAIAAASGLFGGYLWIQVLRQLRHGLDGDALGAVVELTVTTSLLAAVLSP